MCCAGCHWWAAAPPANSHRCGPVILRAVFNRSCVVLQKGDGWRVNGIPYVKFGAVKRGSPFFFAELAEQPVAPLPLRFATSCSIATIRWSSFCGSETTIASTAFP